MAGTFATCIAFSTFFTFSICAETPSALQNTGKPMRVAIECPADDLQSLGLSCSDDEPCALFLELSAIEPVGAHLFLAGNIHSPTATLSSILLASTDSGKTWNEPYRRIPFSELEQIQFIDFEAGWISGSAIQSLAHDPFFLLTTDGGKTWHERPVLEEPRVGSIEQFWFESRKAGTLVVTAEAGKYEKYDTMTGGESWAVKQVSSKPLTLTRPRTPSEAAWRLRADPKNHSYDVETKEAAGWQRVASFLVEIGSCK